MLRQLALTLTLRAASAATAASPSAAAHTATRAVASSAPARGLDDFFEPPLKDGEKRTAGRAWTAADLRTKSWDDLHKLWIVLLKERNLLLTARDAARAKRERLANPFRLTKVRKSMARVKGVMWERARAEHTGKDLVELRRFIDAL